MIQSIDELSVLKKGDKSKKLLAIAPRTADLKAISEATKKGLITSIIIGNKEIVDKVLESEDIDLKLEIIDEKDNTIAIKRALKKIEDKEVDVLMSGSIPYRIFSDIIVDAALESGAKLLSLVTAFETEVKPNIQFLTDAAINSTPNLEEKLTIVTNAIDLAHKLGFEEPKVALLAANEKINVRLMPTTVHAATIAKMNISGQIRGAIIDGPLALDNAFSERAAKVKGIKSPVAGKADILVAPNIVAANLLYKVLIHLCKAKIASVVVGASIPIVLTSRVDSVENKLRSIALGAFLARKG